jgi:Zn-dependent metalloprotease
LFAVCASAFAVMPHDAVLPNIHKEVLPLSVDPHALNNPQWRDLIKDDPESWTIFVNPLTGLVHRAFGKPVDTPFKSVNQENILEVAEWFIDNYGSLLCVDKADLELLRIDNIRGKWYVSLRQIYKGVVVYNSRLELRITDSGKVFLFGGDIKPGIEISVLPLITREEAISIAKRDLGKYGNNCDCDEPYISVYSVAGEKGYDYHSTFCFNVINHSVPLKFFYAVDIQTGEIVSRINDLMTVTHQGTVYGNVKPMYNDDATVSFPFIRQRVTIDGAHLLTNTSGVWSTDISTGSHTFQSSIYGTYVDVNNEDAADASVSTSFTTTTYNHTWTTPVAQIDEKLNVLPCKCLP